jgi:hypothetical protein
LALAWLPTHPAVRGSAFVALAVALTLAVVALRPHDSGKAPQIVGAGAAPARAQPRSQAKVFNSDADADAVAAAAAGVGSSVSPLTPQAFARPIARYRAYAGGEAVVLARRARVLTAALRRDDRVGARAAWQRADSAFNRVGAAYGALGALGDALDGGAGGLPRGVRDPHWSGLKRIEHGLWSDARLRPRALAPLGAKLQRDVARLRRVLGRSEITPLDYATRAHEILEDVQRDQHGRGTPSGSAVRATADGLAATNVVLATLASVLRGRGDARSQATSALRRLGTALAAIRAAHHGAYPPVAALSLREHQTLTGRLGAALEALRGIPGELETQLPPKVARIPG